MSHLKRAATPFRVHIPENLIPSLHRLRDQQRLPWSEIIEAEDVVHLYYGLGPALFLTFDGRILTDPQGWGGTDPYEVSEAKEVWVAIVIGADTLSCPELLDLLPPRPPDAVKCPHCRGTGWITWRDIEQNEGRVICGTHCGGLGWKVE